MKSGCFGALKLDRLGLNCKANKCSGAGTGDLGVLPTNEKSHHLDLRPMGMPGTSGKKDKLRGDLVR